MVINEIGFMEKLIGFFEDYVIHPISGINIVNILDVLILSWMLYVLYKFIRDRRAFKILLGFGVLIGLYIVSDVLGMVAVNSILQTFYAVGIIALCIIFQPELRDMLEEFGNTTSKNIKRITSRHAAEEDGTLQVVEEICASAFELSSKGEGALIVLERTGRLRNQMTEGVMIDAVVSRQLLCNIFVNRSPLHDGAVIIRNGRVVSASCKSKTISEGADIPEGLGTRHRAAVRISEISDAVVIVVSEETGNISVANNRLLKRDYNDIGQGGKHKSNDLRDDLYKLMTGKTVDDLEPVTAANKIKTAISGKTGKSRRKAKGGDDTI